MAKASFRALLPLEQQFSKNLSPITHQLGKSADQLRRDLAPGIGKLRLEPDDVCLTCASCRAGSPYSLAKRASDAVKRPSATSSSRAIDTALELRLPALELPQLLPLCFNGIGSEIEALAVGSRPRLLSLIAVRMPPVRFGRRLMEIPGVGPLLASAFVVSVADPAVFKTGRDLAAWIGLVPKQNSSGGKERLGSITRAGNRYLRQMLVVGAMAVIRYAQRIRHKAALAGSAARPPPCQGRRRGASKQERTDGVDADDQRRAVPRADADCSVTA